LQANHKCVQTLFGSLLKSTNSVVGCRSSTGGLHAYGQKFNDKFRPSPTTAWKHQSNWRRPSAQRTIQSSIILFINVEEATSLLLFRKPDRGRHQVSLTRFPSVRHLQFLRFRHTSKA